MYELINAAQLGFPELERPYIITKYEQSLGRYRKVFSFTVNHAADALEMLEALNNPEPAE